VTSIISTVDATSSTTVETNLESTNPARVSGLVSTMIAVPVRFSPEMALPSAMMSAKATSWLRFLVHCA